MSIQLRRSAMSIATRIAEGSGRENNSEFAVDLRRAGATCNELEYLILLTQDLELWKPDLCDSLTAQIVEVRKMVYGLLRKMQSLLRQRRNTRQRLAFQKLQACSATG
jgi:four helix bundle protein